MKVRREPEISRPGVPTFSLHHFYCCRRIRSDIAKFYVGQISANEDVISEKTAQDAVRLGQYQANSHEYYQPRSADTPIAKVQAKIVRALTMQGPMNKRQLQRKTHADRDGTELWNRGLEGLIRDATIGKREDGTYYAAR